MPRRTRTTAIGLAACGAIAAAAAIPSLGGAQPSAGSELTLKMKVVGSAPITHGRKAAGDKLPAGDGMIIRLKVFDAAGAPVGRAYTECTNVGRKAPGFEATLQCTQTYDLADGQIVSTGVIRFSELADAKIPIVGGSGAYRGAEGELVAGPPAKGFDSVDVLRLGD